MQLYYTCKKDICNTSVDRCIKDLFDNLYSSNRQTSPMLLLSFLSTRNQFVNLGQSEFSPSGRIDYWIEPPGRLIIDRPASTSHLAGIFASPVETKVLLEVRLHPKVFSASWRQFGLPDFATMDQLPLFSLLHVIGSNGWNIENSPSANAKSSPSAEKPRSSPALSFQAMLELDCALISIFQASRCLGWSALTSVPWVVSIFCLPSASLGCTTAESSSPEKEGCSLCCAVFLIGAGAGCASSLGAPLWSGAGGITLSAGEACSGCSGRCDWENRRAVAFFTYGFRFLSSATKAC